jgi:glycosyltransferase involved in cell wall biosynthesis
LVSVVERPLVSCVMPTRNRRRFVAQSLWYFLRQDYQPRELIVLDDGEDAVGDLVPEDERIRYVRVEGGLSLGAKRNLGCELARGDVIAHWDDDDWIGAERLTRQVEALLAAGADACGASAVLHYRIDAGQAWLWSAAPGLIGSTLVYRRSLWREHGFPDVVTGEDNAFVSRLPRERVLTLEDAPYYVATIHGQNTAPKNVAGPGWRHASLEEVSARLGLDRDFYVALRDGTPWPPLRKEPTEVEWVTVAAPFVIYDGYGSMAEYLVRGLARAGASVNLSPMGIDLAGMSDEFCELYARSSLDISDTLLYFCWPRTDLDRFRVADLFVNTMWESSRLPASWVPQLNRARTVIVPTRFVARLCNEAGVEAPVEVISEGIDPAVYYFEQRPEREGLTTLMVATMIDRKNSAVGVAAWKRAFEDDATARLLIKSRFQYGRFTSDDPRITFVDTNEQTRGIARWYREADVLLALGSEGFGLPLVEGMATGLPAIALSSEGQGDTCEDAGELVLAVKPRSWNRVDEPEFGSCGVHGVPSVEDVANRLRWVDTHRDEARERGRAAAEWVPGHRNVWTKGPAVLDVMECRVRPKRPLRRVHTLWVPSWGDRCGIAQYTASLVASLPEVRVTREAPDLRGVRLLHVEHEPSLLADGELQRTVQEARARGTPVVVNQHAVAPVAHAWEQDADLLLATSTKGAALLRERWPSRRVEHMPHGCPTWFPARKQRRGRVIGAFGFLEGHKGFWELLEAVPRIPGAELLLFSYAKGAEIDKAFTEAARGVRVRHVRKYLPEEEVARRLAAEADVLVFWYRPTAYASTSGAARVGLATGVPVLTSATGLFADLRDVTYQPYDLVEGVERLLEDAPLRTQLTSAAREFCNANSWSRIAGRHQALWRTLERT